jgi:hypothetical protein
MGASSVLVSVAFVTVEPTPGSTDTSPLNDSARFACSRNSRGAMSVWVDVAGLHDGYVDVVTVNGHGGVVVEGAIL